MSKKKFSLAACKGSLGLLFLVLSVNSSMAQELAAGATASLAGNSPGSDSSLSPNAVYAAGGGMSQRTMPLEAFMREVQHEYGIYFSYQVDSLKSTIVVYADPDKRKEPDPDRVLSKILSPVGLTYEKINNVYVITLSPEKKQVYKKKEQQFIDVVIKGKCRMTMVR
jgi:hypothetical protein